MTIIELLSRHPSEHFTIDKIKQTIKTSIKDANYATIYRNVDRLVKGGYLNKSMYGMASQIRINLDNENTIGLLSFIETEKFKEFYKNLRGNIQTAISEITKDSSVILEIKCVLIFGSYAKGKQSIKSDLDILVIYEPSNMINKENYESYNDDIKKSMRGILRTSEDRAGPSINPIIVSSEEHREMILNDEQNVAKETLLNHLILKGYEEYWREIGKCYQKGN